MLNFLFFCFLFFFFLPFYLVNRFGDGNGVVLMWDGSGGNGGGGVGGGRREEEGRCVSM